MQIAKWGNSYAVRLPKKLIEDLNLSLGDEVEIVKAEGHSLTVEKSNRKERALANMQARRWAAPKGYLFNRDEANRR
jgi:antitoxin MazE